MPKFAFALISISIAHAASGQAGVPPQLQSVAEEELRKSAARWNINPRLVFGPGIVAEVMRADEISIGAQFVVKAIAGLEPAAAVALMRFVVLHEMWHVRQLTLYGAGVRNASDDLKKVYECQADVMSISTMTQDDLAEMRKAVDRKKLMAAYAVTYQQLLPAIARQAAAGGATHFHLSSFERWAALRLGTLQGVYPDLAAEARSPREIDHTTRMGRLIDWVPGADEVAWSLALCKRITKYGKDVFGVAVEGKVTDEYKFDETVRGAIRNVTWTYRNRSNRPLKLSVAAVSGYFPKDAPEDYQARQYFDGATASMELAPGETKSVTKSFRLYSPNESFRIFGGIDTYDNEFLLSAEYTAAAAAPPPVASCINGYTAITDTEEARFFAGVLRIAGSERSNFADLPREFSNSLGSVEVWKIKIDLPGVVESKLWISGTFGNYATIKVYEGPDLAAAKTAYAKLVATMRKACSAAKVDVTERDDSDGDPRTLISALTGTTRGSVSLATHRPDPGSRFGRKETTYSVNLFINPAK